ncbi:deoxyribodipyrimidine photo-lyase [Rickettsiales endosymbiont of Peranema trichophorum]|uniref:cryptochrome/photolyase family protein n=1 Tax=Rickettsiales endosymbiont of Peranema trichophorum TaxID=2486577 RepID=UPI0010234CC6|nr:deoxyribodipyrimidine photo-lyase [Rickettsiales endosymbiont of Peranema trichophorum]RZI47199.1 deoxyribodipyrimidine photo-lyase [Rickettsiales endosymbiont of Peranema trichophorum]
MASVVWFRQDLRVSDNPAILGGVMIGDIIPIYIFDDCATDDLRMGDATKVWLQDSLSKLNKSLENSLNLYIGESAKIIASLIDRYKVRHVFCNACYEPWHLDQEKSVRRVCLEHNATFEVFNSNYLWLPTQILKEDGDYYKIFTAYKNKSRSIGHRTPVETPQGFKCVKDTDNATTLADLQLLPQHPWYKNIQKIWDIGEVSAQSKLKSFMSNKLHGYKEGRNYPGNDYVSRLSPHLHFGEISPAQILKAIENISKTDTNSDDVEHFVSEITWREFSCYLLYHFRELHKTNFNKKFDTFSWENNHDLLECWKRGNTGYPIIDAGMRELWQTGYIHNRVRMIAASFLVKNMNIHWQHGMRWFWNCLIDADLANNSASWQWVAGSGVDAAPYFRIFNPITQGEKFDSNGNYTRKFVPELKNIPDKYLFKPWTAPENVLKSAGVVLDVTYPRPIVDCATSRKKALERYQLLSHVR